MKWANDVFVFVWCFRFKLSYLGDPQMMRYLRFVISGDLLASLCVVERDTLPLEELFLLITASSFPPLLPATWNELVRQFSPFLHSHSQPW